MKTPTTKEEIQKRVAVAIRKFEHKPGWLKKRAQRDHATEYLRKAYREKAG